MRVLVLGSGQGIGKSCVVISINSINHVMIDCGIHLGHDDQNRFPDFSLIPSHVNITCILITHFHLDHCGALPYYVDKYNYKGPIYMTLSTKMLCPLLLEDYQEMIKVYTNEQISSAIERVVTIQYNESINVGNGLEIQAIYSGHVPGSAMFYLSHPMESVLYTGDFNTSSSFHHMGSARIVPNIHPNLLITESTYATTLRESRFVREGDFLRKVHNCINSKGKVLIPVLAIGKAQELSILLVGYLKRMNLLFPIYISSELTDRANDFYDYHPDMLSWKQYIRVATTFSEKQSIINSTDPLILFASPAMLHSGFSLEAFKKWAPDPKNMIIIPGYCAPGTIGSSLLSNIRHFQFEHGPVLHVNMQIECLSFSSHTDLNGIIQLINSYMPRCIMLVHGNKENMIILKKHLSRIFPDIPCIDPSNGSVIDI